MAKDGCAYNGYVNSIYTIAITGLNRAGSVPPYGERCPGIMAAAYSRKTFGEWNPVVSSFTHKNKIALINSEDETCNAVLYPSHKTCASNSLNLAPGNLATDKFVEAPFHQFLGTLRKT